MSEYKNGAAAWYNAHLAASKCADAALVAYWTENDSITEINQRRALDGLHKAAEALGYDLVKREREAA